MSRQAKNLIKKNIKLAEWKFKGLVYFLDDYYESLREMRMELEYYKKLYTELKHEMSELKERDCDD